MRGSEELGIEFAGEEGHGDPIWGKLGMSAHRRVSRRVSGWSVESGSRRSCGRGLVDSNAARSAYELAEVSSRWWARCGRVSGERGRGREEWTRPLRSGCRHGGMRALGADERGQERRTDAKCRRCSAAGRPRRRARFWLRQNDGRLTELLWQWLTPKPERVRRWCSRQNWSTSWVLQHCQLEQQLDWPGLKDMKFSKSIKQTAASLYLENFPKCWKQPQFCLVGHFWARCVHFYEMAIKQLLFLIKFATTLL